MALVTILFLFATACAGGETTQSESENGGGGKDITTVKNVILLIGDGMGPNEIKAGEIYKGAPLYMQGLTKTTFVETRSNDYEVTDSAAAATAMATGVRTNNSYVGLDPNGIELETIIDIAKENGKKTGVITTEELVGATPMGFSVHSYNRLNSGELIVSAAGTSNVDLFASYTLENVSYVDYFTSGGYTLIEDVDDISESDADKIFGHYEIKGTAPSMSAEENNVALDRLVSESLEYLNKNEDGFFLMAEGAHIDHGGHANDMIYMLEELYGFDDMVKAVVEWAKDRTDTVVIVTADHETGGLELEDGLTKDNFYEKGDNGKPKNFKWTTTGHSSADVCLFFYGPEIDFATYSSFETAEKIKNTDVFEIMKYYVEIR